MKTIYTMVINDYMPELCKITIPTIKNYANNIGAAFVIIEDRKYQNWPITYEKVQIYELGIDNEWNIFIDADTVINKDMPDLTNMLSPDHVGTHMAYNADRELPYDYYFIQDGRNIGLVTNFIITHNMCHQLWRPLDESVTSALNRLDTKKASHHIVDELCISRNLARYGYKMTGIIPYCYGKFLHLSATVEDNNTLIRAKNFIQ